MVWWLRQGEKRVQDSTHGGRLLKFTDRESQRGCDRTSKGLGHGRWQFGPWEYDGSWGRSSRSTEAGGDVGVGEMM